MPPQMRVLASLKLNYIWSYTRATIYSNNPKHILTWVMLTRTKLMHSLNVAFEEWWGRETYIMVPGQLSLSEREQN